MIYSSDSHDISITERDKSKAKSILLQFPYFDSTESSCFFAFIPGSCESV